MAVKSKLAIRAPYDTRGLPAGYDPGNLFQYRYDTTKPQSGLESFVRQLIPPSIWKSVAFAIDPTYRYKVSPGVISTAGRTRQRATASVLALRSAHGHVLDRSYSQQSNYLGLTACGSPGFVDTNLYDSPDFPVALPAQPVLPDYIKDTTSRTRVLGSSQGELEFFKHRLLSTPRSLLQKQISRRYVTGFPVDDVCRKAGGKPDFETGRDIEITWRFDGHAAYLPLDTYEALTASEVSFNKALALKEAPKMLKAVSPFSRDYSLFRNAVELRDLPRSILQLQKTLENLRKVFDSFGRASSTRDLVFDLKRSARDIPSEYIGYHFGWKQTYKDLVELMELPEKITKKINFLMARSRKATTFRTSKKFLTGASGVSGFVYHTISNFEFNQTQTSRIVRESELRLVVNALFDFPPINNVSLRFNQVWYDRAGINPRFIDIYNLMPWTWLVDWFTGLGNYLELIEEMNHDQSLINWGMLTCHTEGKLVTDWYSDVPQYRTVHLDNVLKEESVTGLPYRHQSTLFYECRTRQDVATLYDVNTTSTPSSLTAYQHSILGSLLLQRWNKIRPS